MGFYGESIMVYSNRFVVCVLLNGIPQSESDNGIVHIPFNTDYSLRFRNKNNRRAVVKFTLDGENVSADGFVIPANSYIDIHRHAEVDKSFRFVSTESTDAIDQGKNHLPENAKGEIVAKFYLEKEYKPSYINYRSYGYDKGEFRPTGPNPWVRPDYPKATYGGGTRSCSATQQPSMTSNCCDFSGEREEYTCGGIQLPDTDKGCTVEGSATGQYFGRTSLHLEDNFTCVRLILKGIVPVCDSSQFKWTTQYCPTCGFTVKKSHKFCAQCGNYL
jgi:hypothetical protein